MHIKQEKFGLSWWELFGVVFMGLLAFSLRLAIAWQPMERLLTLSVADDMFYYLQLAAHFVAGQGVSFDGLTSTNGFHPLHFLICAAVLKLGLVKATAVHLILTLTSLWGLIASCLIGVLVKQLTRRWFWGFLAFVVFALNPYVILLDLNGMETSLYGMFLLASFVGYLHLKETQSLSFWKWAGLGVLVGLTLLARTEAIFLPVMLALDIFWQIWRKQAPGALGARSLVSALVVLLVLLPWVLWSFIHFGTVEQDSGKIFPYIAQLTMNDTQGRPAVWLDRVREGVRNGGWNIYILGNMLTGVPYTAAKKFLVFLVVLPALALGFLLGRYRWSYVESRPTLRRFGFGVLYMVCLFCYYTFHHRAVHWRYFHSMLIVSLPVLMVVLSGFNLEEVLQTRKKYYLTGAVAVFLLASVSLLTLQAREYPAQKDMYLVSLWMRDHLPPEARVGAFNAGIFGFWSQRQVINLDGVANNEMLNVIMHQDLWGYVGKRNIRYICDFDGTLQHYFHLFGKESEKPQLILLQSFGNPAELGDRLGVYQVVTAQSSGRDQQLFKGPKP